MDIERGDILIRGLRKQEYLNSRKRQRNSFLKAVGAILLSLFIIGELLWIDYWDFVNVSAMILIICVLFFSLLALWAFRPSTWQMLDVIYENGISSISTPFLPFSEVEKIGYGTYESSTDGHVNFIKIFGKDRHWKTTPSIWDIEYKNDYYKKATEILKQKCPDVPWVQMEWLEWKKKNKKKDGDKK